MKHFFDIGANVGQTFDYLETLDRDFSDYKFWLFEPSPRHLSGLIKKCESVKYDVTVCPFGVGGATQHKIFFEKDDVLGDSFHDWHASDHEPANRTDTYRVVSSIIGIQEAIAKFTDFDDDIILDIDAEGSEHEILPALMNSTVFWRVREIWVEWHRIYPMPKLTPVNFGAWCRTKNISVIHRGLQNVT